ncbi:MAG: hypothetical protein NTV82_01430 [Candidatus Aminicenantes bacterium]|nr:hypothetical protein [Candidatus Aminicenantes bacterium]
MKKNRALIIIVLAALVVWMALYLAAIRPAFLRWGATAEEAARVLPGDERIPVSGYQCTRALTIDVAPEKIWPWFAQLGVGRAGFYSYSWLENLMLASIHNTYRLVPDWQRRISGDFVRSFQFGTDRPGINGWSFDVLEAGRIFYLSPGWGPFVLEPHGDSQTRLLVRSRGNPAHPVFKILMAIFFDPIHFTMEKRMMVEVKRLAEGRPGAPGWLSMAATAGYALFGLIAAGVIMMKKRKKLGLLLPIIYALLVIFLAEDPIAALVALTALSIIIAVFRAFGRWGWAWIVAFWIYVDLVLIYAKDAYFVFGIVFLAPSCVLLSILALRKKKTT